MECDIIFPKKNRVTTLLCFFIISLYSFFVMSLKRKTPPEKISRLSTTSSTTSTPVDVRSEDDIDMKQELSFHQVMRNEIIAERKR